MMRRLVGIVFVNGTDDEFLRDETVSKQYAVEMVLDVAQPAAAIDVPDVRWGGECRVELRLTARALERGTVQIEGVARLFEGASEDTDDLEDEKVVTFLVPTGGRPIHQEIKLSSTGAGGGDHAEISLSLINAKVEEEE
jgi:hypothetical protein